MNSKLTRRDFTTVLAGVTGVALLNSLPASAQEEDLLAQIKKRGFLRVGTFSIPPETWIDIDSGEWKGIDADFTRAIAKSIGVEVDPVVLVHAALGPALEGNRVDVIAGLYRTAEREKVMAYNKVPFWYGIDVLISRKEGGIGRVEDLKGKVIGTVRGSAQELEAEELKKRYDIEDIRKFDAADPMLLDLKAGRLDAAIWWGYTFDYALQKNPSYDFKVVEYLSPEYLGSDKFPATHYVFAKKGTESLIEAFDAEIRRMQSAGDDKQIMDSYGLTNPAYITGVPK
ncbi:ABC transporter substrate-binding protein [Mesorhizobium sp. BAC0120]|uniref:substrate-binding periplasmic protein n=1 Tax=Mesorhizobium sp. BAC0120 TaxID=3090670 RepID=UPI00298C258B|nr:ABC transporter substrate-binding protein [Mesorhizobium sp. BAC0120]MDW6022916.1 ABC transporter substrate-binding protein [Mesorhizobium sp. BAC0120]